MTKPAAPAVICKLRFFFLLSDSTTGQPTLTLSFGQTLGSSLLTLLTDNGQTSHIGLGLISLALLVQLPVLLLGSLLLSSLPM
jgi:hypothetical protein